MADLQDLTYAISFAVKNDPLKQANSSIKNMEGNFHSAANGANKAAKATGDIGKYANNSSLSISSLGKTIAGAFVVKKAVDFGKSLASTGIEGAASLEQYRNTLNVVMGDQKKAAKTFKWAVDFANKTPFETDEIVQATVKLQSYGIEAQKNMPIIGDMAGVMGKSLDQAVEAVADAQTGELERLKEFGITKQQIIDHGNKIMRGKEIVNNKGQITDQKSFNQVLFDLMGKRFKGGMDLQANSFKGIMSTISGVFKTSLAKMMGISDDGKVKVGGMFDTIKNQAKLLSDKLQSMAADGTLERWGNNIANAFNGIIKAFSWIMDNKDTIISAFAGILTTIMTYKIITTIVSIFAKWKTVTEGVTLAQALLNAVMAANPFALVISIVAGLTAAFITAWNTSDNFRNAVINLWDSMKTGAQNALNFVIDKLNSLIPTLNKAIDLINKIPGVEIGHVGPIERKTFADKPIAAGGAAAMMSAIPKMANGGITTGPTTALIGEGKEREAVIPLSKLDNLLNTGSVSGKGNGSNGMVFAPNIKISVNAGSDAEGTAIAVKKAVQEAVDEMFGTVSLQLGYTNI